MSLINGSERVQMESEGLIVLTQSSILSISSDQWIPSPDDAALKHIELFLLNRSDSFVAESFLLF